jgi:hypothetical protein
MTINQTQAFSWLDWTVGGYFRPTAFLKDACL